MNLKWKREKRCGKKVQTFIALFKWDRFFFVFIFNDENIEILLCYYRVEYQTVIFEVMQHSVNNE